MSKEGTVEEVISPLLKQLADARLLANKFQENGGGDSSSVIDLLFGKMERQVREMEVVFHRTRRWERDVMDEFGSVARRIDEILEDVDGQGHVFQWELQSIGQAISTIKERVTPPLQLPPLESSTSPSSSSRPSVAAAQNIADALQQPELDGKILESSAMAILQASYDNLDLQLKLCLLCFSIFPENSIIKKRALVYWWIGEGLVSSSRGNTAEEIGEYCFEQLISKGLVEPIRRKHNPVVDRCKMHPWIRLMLISVARRGEFFDFDQDGRPSLDFSRSRRACLSNTNQRSPGLVFAGADELLTVFNVNEPYLRFRKGWLMNMRKLAVLQLGRWQCSAKHHIEVEHTDLLGGLGSLKHATYLSLQGISRITELPASIGELSNLRILDLRACHNLEKLTAGITSLKRLTHLDVSECYLLEQMPRGLGSLPDLQVLKGFVVGSSRSKDPCRLNELTKLEKLRKLSINIGGQAVATEAEMNELQGFRALRSLTLTWGVVLLPSRKGAAKLTPAATMTMNSLLLPSGLQKLDLRCFPRPRSPQWLNPTALRSLTRLYIRGGKLGSLELNAAETWKVEVLRLKFLGDLHMDWSQLRAAFPRLTCLEILECHRLGSLPCNEEGLWVPRADAEDPDPRRSGGRNDVPVP